MERQQSSGICFNVSERTVINSDSRDGNFFYEIQNNKEFLNDKKITSYMMKVLMLNGREQKKSFIALEEMKKDSKSVEAEIVQVGNKDVSALPVDVVWNLANVFLMMLNELAPKFEEADGIVVASPVYFASANATLIATLDRLFFSTSFDKTMKVGASVVCARRGGCSATFDELNKYFTISNMPIAASQYWLHTWTRTEEADRDEEGKQTIVLARNMTFLMKSIELGKKQFGLPEKEEHAFTHFIR